MTIKCADSAGFCFGVKRAVDTVYDLLPKKIMCRLKKYMIL